MNSLKIFVLFFFIIGCTASKVIPLKNAHAHNDYEHKRPLFDALDNHFISVEADVHLINNELYVSHFLPIELDSSKTLEALYLKPLINRITKNQGKVYKGYDDFFYLMIDIKTEAKPSYDRLKNILMKYHSIISSVKNGKEEGNKPIKIVVTGMKGRPFDQILADEPKYASLDGRFDELGKGISSEVMPYISENYKNYLSFSGEGNPSVDDINTVTKMVESTHKEGKKLRFWASPDKPKVWQFLLDNQVDLVNTDSLTKFKNYMAKRKN